MVTQLLNIFLFLFFACSAAAHNRPPQSIFLSMKETDKEKDLPSCRAEFLGFYETNDNITQAAEELLAQWKL